MAEKMRFVLNRATVGNMLKGNGFATRQLLNAAGTNLANAAGDGFESKPGMTGTRARVAVMPITPEARRREAKDHVLASVIGAARV